MGRSSFSTPKKTNTAKKVTIVEEQQDMRMSRLVKMAAMDLQRRDLREANWSGMGNLLDKESCVKPYGNGEGRGILFSSCI